MIKTFRRLLLVVVLLVAAYVGFRWGPAVFPRLEAMLGDSEPTAEEAALPEPTRALADSVLDRFEAFRAGEAGTRMELDGRELTAVVRYSLPGLLPPGVSEPRVELAEDKANISARVALEAFSDLPDLESVVGLLPDTVDMEIRGSLAPLDQRNLVLVVDRVRAGRFPIPDRLVGDLVEGLRGDRTIAGLPDDGLRVPLPDGLARVYFEGDRLVLLAETEEG